MMLDHGYRHWYIFFSNITELNTENPIDVQPSVVYGNSERSLCPYSLTWTLVPSRSSTDHKWFSPRQLL